MDFDTDTIEYVHGTIYSGSEDIKKYKLLYNERRYINHLLD